MTHKARGEYSSFHAAREVLTTEGFEYTLGGGEYPYTDYSGLVDARIVQMPTRLGATGERWQIEYRA